MDSDLRDNVSCTSESIDSEMSCLLERTCHHQRTVPDQARAQKGSHLHVAVRFGQRKTKGRVGHGEFCIAPINRITSEPSLITQIFLVCFAIAAMAAGPTDPRNSNTSPDTQMLNLRTALHN